MKHSWRPPIYDADRQALEVGPIGGSLLRRSVLWLSENARVERFVADSRLTRRVVSRFVAGARLDDAIRAIRNLNQQRIGGILDLLGEGVSDAGGAASAFDDYLASIKCIRDNAIDTTVSVKLTQLGLVFDKQGCLDYLHRLATEAHDAGTTLEIDMEQSEYVSETLDAFTALRREFDDVRLAIQVYLRRTPADLEAMAALRPKIRLVKGAYSEPAEIAIQKRAEIDQQYRFLTDWLFERGTDPAIATHDKKLLDHARRTAERYGGKEAFEIQMLYGIRRDLQRELASEGYRVRVYVPFGSAWYPYLMRRMGERPANLGFFLRALVNR